MAGNGSVLYKPKRGETLRLSDRTSIQILAPDSALAFSTANVNNASIVFKLTHVDVGVIFTGDLEYEGDVMLESMAPYLKADVLKVAHHGSITSSTEFVLKLIDPKFAVIFVGKGNKFRHPSPIVMERLGRLGI